MWSYFLLCYQQNNPYDSWNDSTVSCIFLLTSVFLDTSHCSSVLLKPAWRIETELFVYIDAGGFAYNLFLGEEILDVFLL